MSTQNFQILNLIKLQNLKEKINNNIKKLNTKNNNK